MAVRPKTPRNLRPSEVEDMPTTLALSQKASQILDGIMRQRNQTASKALETLVIESMREGAGSVWPRQIPQWLKRKHADRAAHGSDFTELVAALLNFVNLGECDLYVPSFLDRQWSRVFVDQTSPLARALREALLPQLQALASGGAPKLPTRVKWAREDLSNVIPDRLVEYVLAWHAFDGLLKTLAHDADAPMIGSCARCGGFILHEKRRGKRRHYCVEEHRNSATGGRDHAAYMRGYRASLKAGAVSIGDRRKK